MNTLTNAFQTLSVTLGYLFLSMILISCSGDDEAAKVEQSNNVGQVNNVHYDHTHDSITDMKKHPFEHQFAQQCVAREVENSVNKNVDQERFAEPCMCIAIYLMKNLTAVEAEKYLHEKKHPQSLRIRYETAAYNCLQKQQPDYDPKIFETR